MGGGTAGSFGNTRGSFKTQELSSPKGSSISNALDIVSGALAAASAIPVIDTFADLAAIPVDLARGDYVGAGLDLFGAVPIIGEVADTIKIAKTVDKVVDVAKTAKKVDKVVDATKAVKKAKKATKVTSIANNAKTVAKKYNLNKNGFFGTKGKNAQVFKSNNPIKSSSDFYKKISRGGKKSVLSNGKGVQTVFPDGSRVVYRKITKTPDSPAVSITVTNSTKLKSQKIHFIKE